MSQSFFTRAGSGAIPRGLATSGPAVLSYGFRPFFLLAGVWAVLAMALWLPALILGWPVGGAYGQAAWHAHEMLFGYTGAVLAGFMLTAIPNWTGRLPVSGPALLGLVAVWLLGRAALLAPGAGWLPVALVLEAAFLPLLGVVALREIVAGRNWKNAKIVVVLALLSGANVWFHVAAATGGDISAPGRLAVAGWVVLISLVGGRIVPSFTRNWLARHGAPVLPAPFGRADRLALALTAVALAAWVIAPQTWWIAVPCALAGAAQAWRLGRWHGWRARAEPIVLVLHLAYGFIPLGLLAVALAGQGSMTQASAMHVLSVGAIGGMTLAVMTRASLGHTGRPIVASPLTVLAYLAIVLAALARPLADAVPDHYLTLLGLSGALWLLAFAAFLVRYAPILLAPRLARDG